MDADPGTARWGQIDDLLDRAQEVSPDRREQFLREACGEDLALFQEVRSLLEHAASGEALFDHLGDSLIGSRGPKPPPADTPVGAEVGAHRIEDRLGDGGMGWVCRAVEIHSGEPRAIKFLPAHLRSDPRSVRRFMEEGKVQGGIVHPNVVEVLGVGTDDFLGPYIVMPFYEGGTLRTRLAEGALEVRTAVSIARQVALGLAAAHARDVIHRDVKPANILVEPSGGVRVLDFGAAKQSDVSLTETGKVLGTVTYMAPEQVTGEVVVPETDVWALGIVLQEMVTGRHPFRERSLGATVRRMLTGEPDPLRIEARGGPEALAAVVTEALSRDPGGRPTAAAMADRLAAVQASSA